MNFSQFLAELKRRKVYKVAAAYAVVAWVVIQAASILLPAFEAPAWVMKALISAVALGFPVAMLLSWAFDLTADGIVRTADAPGQKPSRHTGRKLTASIIAGVLIGIALTLFQNFRGEFLRQADWTSKSIAVLPFANASEDTSQEYFSDGLTEEMITGLTQIPELRVIGRSSSFRFKGQTQDARTVGRALGVGNLLEGTVRRAGNRVRISVSLVNVEDGSQRWSETYDRELQDIFAVQEEIARSVADELRVALLGQEIKATAEPSNQNLDAYNAFLRGQYEFGQFNVGSTRRAIEHYKEAIRIDPRYARAYGELAWSFCRLGFFTGAAGRDAFAQGREAAEMALQLGPEVASAYSALAYIHMNLDWNLAAAEGVLARATRSAPRDPRIKNTLAILRTYQNRPEEALVLRRDAVALDPLDVILQGNLATVLTILGRYDEGEAAARRGLELQPNSSLNHYLIARIHLLRGDADAALREAQAESGEIYRNLGIALAQTARGDRAAADEALATMIRLHGQDNPFRVSLIYALRREDEKVFEWLERAYTAHDPRVINSTSEDLLKRFHSDPRFIAFCRKVGLTPPVG
ncbi:MAG: Adenylate cyclase [uncultured Chthoniobacterales bacterium]|uniref:Adenylate cyclase n=1 Tax=uncultured Chthoniobacterales bacterium TaxID=1836801 RepID=A0A6J4HB75_9BACT|nr:MAG: Adenylate cyclase [uncultured Chthoniobacterales bacterium]